MQINVRSSQDPKKFGRGRKSTPLKKGRLKDKGAVAEVPLDIATPSDAEVVESADSVVAEVPLDTAPTEDSAEAETPKEESAPKKGGLSFKAKQSSKGKTQTPQPSEDSIPVEAELVDEDAILNDLNERPAASLTLSFILFFIGGLLVAGILGWFSSGFLASFLVTLGVIA